MFKHYAIDMSLVHDGDILLTTDRLSPISFVIRHATHAPYSHAAIVSGTSVLEATGDGVFSNEIRRLRFVGKNDAGIIRLKRGLQQDEIDTIVNFVRRSRIGRDYSVADAIESVGKDDSGEADDGKSFCSRLVAEAYAQIGVSLSRVPTHCTPADIFSLKNDPEWRFFMCTRATNEKDEVIDKTDNAVKDHQLCFNTWLSSVKKRAHAVTDENSAYQFLCDHPEMDDWFVSALLKSNYLDSYKLQFDVNHKWVFNVEAICDAARKYGVTEIVGSSMCYVHDTRHWLDSYNKARDNVQCFPLKAFKLVLTLYSKLLMIKIRRLECVREALFKLVSEGNADPSVLMGPFLPLQGVLLDLTALSRVDSCDYSVFTKVERQVMGVN